MIHGFFRDNAGFVAAHIMSSSAEIDETITFMVDTGASKTALLDRDAIRLGIDYAKLPRAKEDLSGIGGTIQTHIIPDAIAGFVTTKGVLEIELPIYVVKHPLDKLSETEKQKILRIPSLLGRDIINKYKLVFDFDMDLFLAEKKRRK